MSVGQLLVLPGLAGRGPVEVREGDGGGIVIVTRQDRVVVYNMEEKEVEHTWYVDSGGGEVRAAVAARGRLGAAAVVVARGSGLVLAGRDTTRLEDCAVVEAGAEVHEVVEHQGELLVVFRHGGVESLAALQEPREGAVRGVLRPEERVVQCRLVQEGAGTRLGLVGEGPAGLVLVTAQLVLEGEGRALAGEHREVVGPRPGEVELGPDLSLHGLAGGSCLQVWRGAWQQVVEVPGAEHCALASLGTAHIAVMAGVEEGGFLHLVSTAYSALVTSAKLKSCQHEGAGLHWVAGRIFIASAGKLLAASVTGLDGGLQALLGSSAPSPCGPLPTLLERADTTGLAAALRTLQDLPEPLLVDCLLYFIDPEHTDGLEPKEQLRQLGQLLGRPASEPLLEQEAARIPLGQVVTLLGLIDTLLTGGEEEGAGEAELLAWVSVLLNTHYMQLVVAKDPETRAVVARVQETVCDIQQSARILADSRVLTHNIMNTKIPNTKNNNQAYCIEIIQI
jgi:hypothetical protein